MRRKKRIEFFLEYLKRQDAALCIIEDPLDLYYFTGLNITRGRLWLHEKEKCLFTDARYLEMAAGQSLLRVLPLGFENESSYLERLGPQKVVFDSSFTSYGRFVDLQRFLEKCKHNYQMVPFDKPTKAVRLIKDPYEIKDLKMSAQLLKKAYRHVRRMLKEGMTEKQAAKIIELYGLVHGSQGMAFEPIVAFGKNSAMPHYRAGEARLKKGSIVLMDFGFIVNHYHSDASRVHFFGEPHPAMLRALSTVKKAHKEAISLCRPGTKVGQLDEAVRSIMRKENVEEHFIHALGHGIGLETHEFPRIKFDAKDKDFALVPGMVLAIEPGLYFPGKGGVRWEDMVHITQNGCEVLTS